GEGRLIGEEAAAVVVVRGGSTPLERLVHLGGVAGFVEVLFAAEGAPLVRDGGGAAKRVAAEEPFEIRRVELTRLHARRQIDFGVVAVFRLSEDLRRIACRTLTEGGLEDAARRVEGHVRGARLLSTTQH